MLSVHLWSQGTGTLGIHMCICIFEGQLVNDIPSVLRAELSFLYELNFYHLPPITQQHASLS